MSDYISREAAIEKIRVAAGCAECAGSSSALCVCNVCDVYNAIRLIKSLPAADVEPVVHGRWECVYDDSTGETDITCSHCKNTRTVNGCFVSTDGKPCYFEDDYCPNCGSKMDLEAEHNDD
jgi:hypothetical protein